MRIPNVFEDEGGFVLENQIYDTLTATYFIAIDAFASGEYSYL